MPGTIQVSVLDLMDFPSSSSSSSSSSISVKVSMGKREYQTLDKGDFSFPLSTLRDNLIVTLHDGEGKELSRTGVETMLVVQKGILDDFFVLEGGGRLHMKLQFSLNDNERKRIQELREIALKKKQDELLITSRLRHSETAPLVVVGGNFGSPTTSLNHEVTDSSESLDQVEAVINTREPIQSGSTSNSENHSKDRFSGSGNGDRILLDQLEKPVSGLTSEPDIYHEDLLSDLRDRDGILLDTLEQPVPNDMDGSEGTSSMVDLSEEIQRHHTETDEEILDKIETRLAPIDNSTTPILSLEALDPNSRENSVSFTLKEAQIMDKIETKLTPTDITISPILSLEALETHSGDHSVSGTLHEDRIPDKIETQLPPTDIPSSPISSLEALDNYSKHRPDSGILEKDKVLDKIKTRSPSTSIPMRPISLKKVVDPYSGHRFVSSTLEEENRIGNPEKQSELKRTPSNVRKMISAFESNRAKGLAPRVDAATVNLQLNKSKSTSSLKGANATDLMIEKNIAKPITKTNSRLSSTGKSQETNVQPRLKHISEQKDTGFEQRTQGNIREQETSKEELQEVMTEKNKTQEVAETESSLSSTRTHHEMKLQESVDDIREQEVISVEQHGKDDLHERETSQEELTGVSAAEADTISRQIPASLLETDQSCSVSKDHQDSSLKALGKDELRTCLQDIEKLSIPETLSEKVQSVADCEVEQYPVDSLGRGMFADESWRLCITTGSKQVMDLVGGSGNFSETDRRKMSFSRTEAVEEQNMEGDACNKMNINSKSFGNLRKTEHEGSVDVRLPGHFIGQAVKIAVIMAFGTLVLVRR